MNQAFLPDLPDFLKLSNVIPLHKTGGDKLFNNYRPISLTCQFAKILEKIFYYRFYDDIKSSCIDFINTITKVYHDNCPLVKVTTKFKNSPWIDNKIK